MKTNKKLMMVIPFIFISVIVYIGTHQSLPSNSPLGDLIAQNVEALAEDTSLLHPCPSPYDVWEAKVRYTQRGGTYMVKLDGEIMIGGKKFTLSGAKAGAEFHFTYEIGDCEKGYSKTCCDHTVIGNIINVAPK